MPSPQLLVLIEFNQCTFRPNPSINNGLRGKEKRENQC
jgi:hypothetical protein